MANGFDPNGLNAIAQGANAFVQSFRQERNDARNYQMQRESMDMKKAYYEAQMAKLKSATQPTKIDMQNVMTNVNKFRAMKGLVDQGLATPEDLSKFAQGTIEDAETPGMATAYAKLLNMGGDQARYLNPAEAKLATSLSGQYAVGDRIASQEKIAGQKIQSAEKLAFQADILKRDEQINKLTTELERLNRQYGVDAETQRSNKAKEDILRERNKIMASKAAKGPGAPRATEAEKSMLRQIETQRKAIQGYAKDPMVGARVKAAAQDDLNELYDQYKAQFGKDLRATPAPQAPAVSAPVAKAPMSGQGPLRIYESSERQKAPVGAVVRNSQGKLFKKTQTGYLPIQE